MKKTTTKTVQAQNMTLRQLTIHGLSGKSWHLPPAYTAAIPQNELIGNAMVDKLIQKKVLFIPPEGREIKEKAKSAERVLQKKRQSTDASIEASKSNPKKKISKTKKKKTASKPKAKRSGSADNSK